MFRLNKIGRPTQVLSVFLFSFLIVALDIDSPQAASLDFGWGTPIEIKEKIERKNDKHYLAWPIQVSNRTGKRWLPRLEIVAVTDTGKQYTPTPSMKVKLFEETASLANMEVHLFPSVTRKAVVVFEKIDSEAKVIHFYVGGLIDLPQREMKYLRITYKRSPSGWKWEDTGALE